jgi:hypothetical protein
MITGRLPVSDGLYEVAALTTSFGDKEIKFGLEND